MGYLFGINNRENTLCKNKLHSDSIFAISTFPFVCLFVGILYRNEWIGYRFC